MTATIITAGDVVQPGFGISSGNDGTVVIQAGPNGAKVNAVSIDATGKASFPQNQSGSAPFFSARAWCTFDGRTAGTNAPAAGGNVASVTRASAGNYTVTFSTPMPDALYSVHITVANGNPYVATVNTKSTGSFTLYVFVAATSAFYDSSDVSVVVFR